MTLTGLAPRQWTWANRQPDGNRATFIVPSRGIYTLTLAMREDGLRFDRLLLTTDPTFTPSAAGPTESIRLTDPTPTHFTTLARTITYDYDFLYRLTHATYTSGEQYSYTYDPVGNRLEQIIGGDTTSYVYDAANRLATVNGTSYTFDANGNLLTTGVQTNTWDAANRLIRAAGSRQPLAVSYDGLGNWVAQTQGTATTHYALDVAIGLPEVLYTSEGNAYLHLPGVIMTENATGDTRYLLSDGLGSVRHVVDETATVIAYKDFDPYGNPLPTPYSLRPTPYGYTGEWWEDEGGLLYLRARWYQPETGTFLSQDAVESEPPYQYVRGNVVNLTDPSGYIPLDIGNRSFYSCKCGWLDTSHASSRKRFIEAITKGPYIAESDLFGAVSFNRSTSLLGIQIKDVQSDFFVDKTALHSERYEIALGIFIAYENFFEASQGLPIFSLSQSSFSEEDLVSDLIGFHIGYGALTNAEPKTRKDFMKICEVVGREYFKQDRAKFVDIHQKIAEEYKEENGGWGTHNEWGTRPPGRWNGSIELEESCDSLRCGNQDQLPSELLRITPNPPGDGWIWYQGRIYGGVFSTQQVIFDPATMNSLPLHWGPTGQ